MEKTSMTTRYRKYRNKREGITRRCSLFFPIIRGRRTARLWNFAFKVHRRRKAKAALLPLRRYVRSAHFNDECGVRRSTRQMFPERVMGLYGCLGRGWGVVCLFFFRSGSRSFGYIFNEFFSLNKGVRIDVGCKGTTIWVYFHFLFLYD